MVAALIIGWAASFGFRRRRGVYLALLLATILFVASLFLTIYAYEQQVSHLKQEYPNAETYYLSDDGILSYCIGALLIIAWIKYLKMYARA